MMSPNHEMKGGGIELGAAVFLPKCNIWKSVESFLWKTTRACFTIIAQTKEIEWIVSCMLCVRIDHNYLIVFAFVNTCFAGLI